MSSLKTGRKEALLVLRAQLGDGDALDALLRRTVVWLRGYLVNLLRDEHLAADVRQDVLLILWRRLKHLREPRAYRPWVYRIATREAFRRLKKHAGRDSRTVSVDPETLGPAINVAPLPPDPDEIDRLSAEVQTLPPNTRTVVVLHYFEGLSIRHVAAVLDIAEGTVKSRLAYALARLRGGLAADHGQPRRNAKG